MCSILISLIIEQMLLTYLPAFSFWLLIHSVLILFSLFKFEHLLYVCVYACIIFFILILGHCFG